MLQMLSTDNCVILTSVRHIMLLVLGADISLLAQVASRIIIVLHLMSLKYCPV